MLKTNFNRLIKISVMGEVASPVIGRSVYSISAAGKPLILPGVGGITYNLRVGDLACGWEADHVEPGVSVENKENDPRFLEALKPEAAGEKLEIPVTHIIPAAIMGSGLGANHAYSGDYDIQLFDEKVIEQYGLEDLRLGDLVAIIDADHSFGRIYKQGAISIGIVIHTNCVTAGHGPGVTSLITSPTGKIIPKIDEKANIAYFLKLRTARY